MTVLTLILFAAILWFVYVELCNIKEELKKIREAKEKEVSK